LAFSCVAELHVLFSYLLGSSFQINSMSYYTSNPAENCTVASQPCHELDISGFVSTVNIISIFLTAVIHIQGQTVDCCMLVLMVHKLLQ